MEGDAGLLPDSKQRETTMKYKYTAMDSRGSEVEGEVEAPNEARAIAMVKDKGLFPTRIADETRRDVDRMVNGMFEESERRRAARRSSVKKFKDHFGSGIGSGDVAEMMGSLAGMVDTGLPLLRALHVMAKGERDKRMAAVLNALADDIERGSTFAEAMANHPKVFDYVCVNMVKAGEASGSLHTALYRLVDLIRRNRMVSRKVATATGWTLGSVLLVAVGVAVCLPSYLSMMWSVFSMLKRVINQYLMH
jgi:type IV pilus assembly protein PilC